MLFSVSIVENLNYRDTGITLPGTQLHSAVQIDVASFARELERVEGETVGCSHSVALHLHRLVCRVRAAAQKQESRHDRDWPATTKIQVRPP